MQNCQWDVEVQQLSKYFVSNKRVLQDVSFQVAAKSSTAIIGKNGSGKSTLLRCCLRLIEPSSGRISLLQENVNTLKRRGLRRLRGKVGFIFQRHHLVPRLCALSNVIHGAQAYTHGPQVWLQSLAPNRIREEAMHWLESVGMVDFAANRVDTLSGGESQKVAIARAFMQKPKLILADEPAASLDPRSADEAMELLYKRTSEQGITLLFVTHNVNHALQYADQILGLQNGEITIRTTPSSESEASLRGFFGERYRG